MFEIIIYSLIAVGVAGLIGVGIYVIGDSINKTTSIEEQKEEEKLLTVEDLILIVPELQEDRYKHHSEICKLHNSVDHVQFAIRDFENRIPALENNNASMSVFLKDLYVLLNRVHIDITFLKKNNKKKQVILKKKKKIK